MKLKALLLFVQRFVLVELEAFSFMMVIHVFYKWFFYSELQFIDVFWLQLLFVLMASPLYYFSNQKRIAIWIAAVATVSLVIGYQFGMDAPWLPILLSIWRSISLSKETEYLAATYIRMINIILFLILYFVIANLYHLPMWWAIPLLTGGSICFTVIGLACANLLEQWSWNPNQGELKRIGSHQFIFVTGMIIIIVCIVALRDKFIFLFTQIISLSIKAIVFLLTPLIILLSKVISSFYELLQGGEGEGKKGMGQMSEMILKTEVKDSVSDHNWIWSLVTVVFIIGLLMILVKFIKQMRRHGTLNNEEDEWTEITEQSDLSKRNNLFSFFKNLNPFGKRHNLDQIRLSYIDFLKQYAELAKSYPTNSTTRDLMKKASEGLAVNEEELKHLTKIYEDHRYGGKSVDSNTVQRMKAAVENWIRRG
ncbi:DUF4129 domain-containing protein [Pseudoneobacillus rhizosphaerae]|uniref:DUF4129 domain-containing protein n=1 Tax=Pseudoneobacillus rhizosphaerae TaxID=2880968 RepID=A0A9C7L9B8_9BACI|nr:DUF4129 domain-containing protein [Pseudoneobacillus rhizosphaerae]CAG9606792.1 hypothetical protein NEOCIP111885_00480 [Pseudoneobacillus rhizosphaerae]